jgi:hypothetical protein
VCLSLRFDQDEVSAAYDWGSLLAEAEPVLAGVVAGAHTEDSLPGAQAPTSHEIASFFSEYKANRHPRST